MRMLLSAIKFILIFITVFAVFDAVAVSPSFVSMYVTYPVKPFEFELVSEQVEFKYEEAEYANNSKIEYIAIDKAKYDTPENAMIARFSALAAKDIQWWRGQWESVEQADLSLSHLMANGATEKQIVNRWGNITEFNHIRLIRRITFNNYAIVTYQVVSKSKQSKKNKFEIPAVFKKIRGAWKVSSDLSKSPLIAHSPWVSKKYNAIEANYWIVQEDD